jgi:hypothetical protein
VQNGRWEHAGQRYFDGEVEPCMNGIHPGRVHFDLEDGVGTPSRCNTLRALRVLKWWDGNT